MENQEETQEETSIPTISNTVHYHQSSSFYAIKCVQCMLFVIAVSLSFLIAVVFINGEDYTYTGLVELSVETAISAAYEYKETGRQRKSLLYIVTSSSEFNKRRRGSTVHLHSDRLMALVVPVMKESIESMQKAGFEVDLYMIVSYNMTDDRRADVLEHLPDGVNLEVWSDAVPVDYDIGGRMPATADKVVQIQRSLARQHRFVVKDKLWDYDIFAAFEDDMLVLGDHVRHHLHLSEKIQRFRQEAPDEIGYMKLWFGDMKEKQLQRMRPGFIRVEVLLKDEPNMTQTELEDNIPFDFDFSDLGYKEDQHVDPSICCNVGSNFTAAPKEPSVSQLMLWETGIGGLGVRELPDGSWVALLPGPRAFPGEPFDYEVGKFHSASAGKLKNRPSISNPKFMAQSAGWIATRDELLEMETKICRASILPPFGKPHVRDGLYMNNVEFWSGGLQLWCQRDGCSFQRVIQLDPKNFSKHLMYHTANNKQTAIDQERRVLVDNLLAQLNGVRKAAIQEKEKKLGKNNE